MQRFCLFCCVHLKSSSYMFCIILSKKSNSGSFAVGQKSFSDVRIFSNVPKIKRLINIKDYQYRTSEYLDFCKPFKFLPTVYVRKINEK